jgi:micrococcal nuclease
MKLKPLLSWFLFFIFLIFIFLFVREIFKNKISSNHIFSPSLKVVKIVDGDTIDILKNNKIERIRLIGIDAPETVDPSKPVQCFGPESTDEIKKLLQNQKVKLENDPTQGEKDKYNRLLRYVFLENGTDINKKMIEGGFAYEYTYDKPYKYKVEYKQAEKSAKINHLGLWSVCYN